MPTTPDSLRRKAKEKNAGCVCSVWFSENSLPMYTTAFPRHTPLQPNTTQDEKQIWRE